MKRALLAICSILLVLASLFGMYACVGGLKDIRNIQSYKSSDAADAKAGIAEARDGIAQLEANKLAYIDGVKTFEDGKIQLESGKAQLRAGEADLRAGEAALAEGQAQIDANTAAYNEGKATLAKIEPIMPYVEMYIDFRDNHLSCICGFSDVQAWFVSVVRPIAAQSGLEIPEDVTDLPAYIQNMVIEGKAQLKQYEDGLSALEAGKAELSAGYASYAAGQKELEAGKKQLEEGDAQLKQYEDGQAALAEGMSKLLEAMGASVSRSGTETSPSLEAMLGDNFNLYVKNTEGNDVTYRGQSLVDLDSCSALCDKAEEYLSTQEAEISSELYGRIAVYALAALATVFGLIAGVCGIVASISGGFKTGKVPGIISAVLAIAANGAGIFTGYTDYSYQIRNVISTADIAPEKIVYTYSGDLQFKALIVLLAVSLIFAIVSASVKKSREK